MFQSGDKAVIDGCEDRAQHDNYSMSSTMQCVVSESLGQIHCKKVRISQSQRSIWILMLLPHKFLESLLIRLCFPNFPAKKTDPVFSTSLKICFVALAFSFGPYGCALLQAVQLNANIKSWVPRDIIKTEKRLGIKSCSLPYLLISQNRSKSYKSATCLSACCTVVLYSWEIAFVICKAKANSEAWSLKLALNKLTT